MTPEEIKKTVEKYYGIDDIAIKSRMMDYVYARIVYAILCRRNTPASYTKIADLLNRDHSTVIHSIKTYNDVWCRNPIAFKKELMDVQILEEQIEVNFNNIENRPELFDIYKRQEAHIDKLSNRLMILQQENIRLNKMIESVTPKLRVLGIDINSYA